MLDNDSETSESYNPNASEEDDDNVSGELVESDEESMAKSIDDNGDDSLSDEESSEPNNGWFSKKHFTPTRKLTTEKKKRKIKETKKQVQLEYSDRPAKKTKTTSLYSKIIDMLENDTTPPTPQKHSEKSEDDSFMKQILKENGKSKSNNNNRAKDNKAKTLDVDLSSEDSYLKSILNKNSSVDKEDDDFLYTILGKSKSSHNDTKKKQPEKKIPVLQKMNSKRTLVIEDSDEEIKVNNNNSGKLFEIESDDDDLIKEMEMKEKKKKKN
eukprot:TRINITY_DN4125_c1_g3_i1.p1 TRINITY_DN4125_c1_g3~~TRINITY_DN4125_c1_g3_i1.p1  ORF type:complete len:269 (+),score=100.33 TRINITY_DN4125_c1_g3_i1:1-807(+)